MSFSRHPLLGNIILTKFLISNLLSWNRDDISSLILNTPAPHTKAPSSPLFCAKVSVGFFYRNLTLLLLGSRVTMTKRLFYKLWNMGDVTVFCLFGISQETSFILFFRNEDGNNQEAVGRKDIIYLGEKADK